MQNRRAFIRNAGKFTCLFASTAFPFSLFASNNTRKVSILFTNDTQSQIESFAEEVPKYAGLGGVVARAALIQKIRAENEQILLFDAGDFWQGSNYFDLYKGAPEIEAMNLMQYDAVCIGEHELDAGIENLALQISKANFAVLCANYTFEHPELRKQIKPYTIIEKKNIRFGVLGIGLNPKGLIGSDIDPKMKFSNPIETANKIAAQLKKKEKCDFVICLSHLGLEHQNSNTFNDKALAKESEHIDLIIGGHSHHLLHEPLRIWNKGKKEILVVQAGWGGVHLGRIDYLFSDKKNILSANAQTVEIVK
ncbi:MAG: metallophosphatase [Phycisphaerales bacterium]|nr:metallophosphatase [Phycisphaerales bacterium]